MTLHKHTPMSHALDAQYPYCPVCRKALELLRAHADTPADTAQPVECSLCGWHGVFVRYRTFVQSPELGQKVAPSHGRETSVSLKDG